MSHLTIVPHGASAAVVLPASVLESIGLRVGDVLEVTVSDRQLILRPVDDDSRRQRLQEITHDVFERRQEAYRRLA
jgi:antitoxin component of MazEF toxin-antitoxin module